MSNARDKANIPSLNFSSTGIDDNASSTAITISSSQSVGIGTTSSLTNTLLNVNGGINSLTGLLGRALNDTFTLNGQTQPSYGVNFSASIGVPSGISGYRGLAFATNSSERMRIDSSGNVGINQSAPGQKLDVGGIVQVKTATSGTRKYRITDSVTGQYFDMGVSISSSQPNLTFSDGADERMRIDSSGNVGIGTSSPSSQSGDADDLVVGSGSGNKGLTIYSGTTSNGAIRFSDGTSGADTYRGQIDYDHNDNSLKFATNASERMRINSSGELLVGTTTAPNIAGAIHVANSSGHGLQITNTSASKNRRIYMQSAGHLYFWNGTNEAYLSDAGAWTNASDERLKDNIRNIEYGLNTVLSTQPRHYERNDVEGTYIGFVAQELQNIIPEVVSGNPDKQLGIDYGSLVAVAFKAIQEQQTKIEELEARITTLETN